MADLQNENLWLLPLFNFFFKGGEGLFAQNIQFLYYRGKNCTIIYISLAKPMVCSFHNCIHVLVYQT